jgi:hypothetical protein
LETARAPEGRGSFPPGEIVQIKAVACELPSRHERPLSRLFVPDIVDIAVGEGVVESISASTVWRILDRDHLKPWRRRSWIYPRDPLFYERAAPVLDLYAGIWRGKPLRKDEFAVSADEKTGLQVLRRIHRTEMARDGRGLKVEHEYLRQGVWAYMAAWDVHRARLFDRVEEKTGIVPFNRLVRQVMTREPYRSARRVFWIVDGGCSHHRSTFPARLREMYPNAVAVSLPVHASWLNQVEIYFSILQRKVLTPLDLIGRAEAAERLVDFGRLFAREAEPFNWGFTRADLRRTLARLYASEHTETSAAPTRKAA